MGLMRRSRFQGHTQEADLTSAVDVQIILTSKEKMLVYQLTAMMSTGECRVHEALSKFGIRRVLGFYYPEWSGRLHPIIDSLKGP